MVAPAPVPPLPDTPRASTYAPVNASGPFNVGFAIYGDSSDYTAWILVTLDGVAQVGNWTLDSPSGSLITLARPITDARITFTAPVTGALVITGAQRPRRLAQNAENRGVTARDFNQTYTAVIAMLRETWDRWSQSLLAPPGESIGFLPSATARALQMLGFDAAGNPIAAQPASALVSAAWQPVVASPTLAAGLALLGVNNGRVVGEEIDWPGLAVPALWLPEDGTTRLRAGFPELWAVLAPPVACVVASGSAIVTGIGSTAGYGAGWPIEGVGIAPGTTILNILDANRITMSAVASGNGTSITVYPYGNGDGVNSFTLPNKLGRATVGYDPASAVLSAAAVLGAKFGEATHLLTLTEIPAHAHGVTDPTHTNPIASKASTSGLIQGPGSASANPQFANFGAGATDAAATGITIQNAGSGAAHNIVQPVIAGRKIIYAGR